MSTAEKIRKDISKMKPGTVFLASDLPTYKDERNSTLKAVNYLAANDDFKYKYINIKKIADGMYYKKEFGLFGELPPSYDSVIHALIYSKNKKVGYFVGHQLFNQKGLSTQVPSTVTVITSKNAPSKISISGISIDVKKKQSIINERDIYRLEFEYILNNIGKIQSIELYSFLEKIEPYIKFIVKNKNEFIALVDELKYKKTKAFLGALIEEYDHREKREYHSSVEHIKYIKNALSFNSTYKMGIVSDVIKNKQKWNIEF